MKKRRFPAALCTVVLCLAIIAAIASYALPRQMQMTAFAAEKQSFDRQSVEKASVAFESAESIYEKLQTIVADELSEEEDPDAEYDPEEIEAFKNELGGDLAQIDMLLSSLDGLNSDAGSSEGKTVLAVREYLNMLRDISADMFELMEYYNELYEALMVFDELDADVDSYTDFASQLYDINDTVIGLMDAIDPPTYLRISHNDLTLRFKEFRDFSEDFYTASAMEDPLRTYSCIYRMDRIEAMLDKSTDNLTGDVELQFEQADKRLSGPIGTLHDELERNIALLLDV